MACLSLAVQGHAQAPEVLPQVFSPNAAELGKYGKVPVSYFNGLPNISIPLTELKAKDYTLPIYLTYHAGGNKPDQHPGWVGLGWTLHAGGCINRIINGKKDETTRYETGFTYDENPGYLYHATEFQTENWDKQTSSGNLLTHGYDYAPDEFQINIEGLNASFYFAGNGEIRIASRSDADFIVTYKMNDGANSIGTNNDRILDYRLESQDIRVFDTFFEFTIITKDGTEYVFGGTEDAIEYSIVPATHDEAYYGHAVDWDLRATANTWMLTTAVRRNFTIT